MNINLSRYRSRVYDVILDNAQNATSQNSKNIQAIGSESQNQTGSIDQENFSIDWENFSIDQENFQLIGSCRSTKISKFKSP